MSKMTEEQKSAIRAERLALVERVRKMPDVDRDALAARCAMLSTVDGHTLSPRNRALLTIQCDMRGGVELSLIGGFDQWRRSGRVVRKGEKSYWLYFPRIGKDDNGVEKLNGFSTASVFDISQTMEDDRARFERRRRGGGAGAGDGDDSSTTETTYVPEKPSTVAPSTVAPSTVAPSTVAPSTVAPSTPDVSAILAAFTAA